MENSDDGIILLDKKEGRSSFEAVKRVRKLLKIKKVGHAGTLDPFATGLLILLLGQGTKLFPYLMSTAKRYRATVRLGIETDTLDPTGSIIRTMPVPGLGMEDLRVACRGFKGEIEQVPPMYSAVKQRGKKAYELARKGIKVALKKRRVMIHHFEVISFDSPKITMDIGCSSGTYIRSLAADFGQALGTCAHVTALRRTAVGSFRIEQALSLDSMPFSMEIPWRDRIIPLEEALPHLRKVEVSERMAAGIRNGCRPLWDDFPVDCGLGDVREEMIQLVHGNHLIAIISAEGPQINDDALLSNGKERVRIMRVFH